MLIRVGVVQKCLQDGDICGVFCEPMRDWPLVFRYLPSSRDSGRNGGVVVSVLSFCFIDLNRGEGLNLQVDDLPWED